MLLLKSNATSEHVIKKVPTGPTLAYLVQKVPFVTGESVPFFQR
jgi:hypothetical protein